MPLVTLFSAPKPFTDPDIARSQRNAIESWRRLDDADVLLLGDEDGLGAAARELGVRHIPGVGLNPNGVPLVSSMIDLARRTSESALLAIINADIILTSDFMQAARILAAQRSAASFAHGFVLVSRRWDLVVAASMDYSEGWERRLCQDAHSRGRLHRPTGSDVFLFPRDCYQDVPDFAIGRAGWDNWMIYKACSEGWAVIDGTPSLLIIHQDHDYRHLPGARPHYDHPDTHANTRLAGGQAAIRYTILDATHILDRGRLLRPRMSGPRFARLLERLLRHLFFFLPEPTLEAIARPRRWSRRLARLFRRPHN